MRFFVFLGLGIVGLLALGVFLLFFNDTRPDASTSADAPTYTELPENQAVTQIGQQNKIASKSERWYSADSLLSSPQTTELTEGFYENTTDEARYSIAYLESQGVITVLLLDENLTLSRQLAEQQLRDGLGYDEASLCDMRIRVLTNEHVDPTYAGQELGLSFCDGSISL